MQFIQNGPLNVFISAFFHGNYNRLLHKVHLEKLYVRVCWWHEVDMRQELAAHRRQEKVNVLKEDT